MKKTNLSSGYFKAASALVAMALLTHSATAATKIWDGGGGDGFWQTGLNWDGNTPPAPGDVLVFTNTTRLNATNNFPGGTGFGGISFSSPAGAFTLFGNAIDLGGNLQDNQPVTTETISLPLTLTGNRNVNVTDTASLTIGGVISGAFGLSKSGGGLLTLDGANTYSGATTIAAGMVSISSDGNLGIAPGSTTPASIVISNGTLRGTANLTLAANRGIALGPVAGAGPGRVDVNSGNTVTYRGIMANNGGTGGLTKGGFGTLVLSGPNTYSGTTIVKNGNLNLDFNDGSSPANNVIASSSALTLGGENAGIGTANWAALNMTATSVKTQTFAGATIDIGPAIIRATNANLVLGSLSHNAGAGLVFVTNGNSTINTTTANENGILGGWAVTGTGGIFNNITMGTEYATVNGTGDIGPYTGYTVHTSGNLHSYASNATNLRINGSSSGDVRVQNDNAGTVTDINTINLNVTRAYSLLVGEGNTLRLGRVGGIFKSDNVNNITWALGAGTTGGGNGTQDAGTLTAGGAPNADGEINFAMNNGTSQSQGSLNVEARITDNGSGKVTVIKSGPQAMKLRGHNTFSGGLYVLGGRMQLAGSEIGTGNPDGGGTGKIVVFPGAYLFLSGIGDVGTTGISLSNLVQIAGNGTQQEPVGAVRFGNGAQIGGTVELIGDARVGGGNLANVDETGISGKVTGNFAFDLGAVQTIDSFFSLFNPANDWTGTTTFNARNTAAANRVHNGASNVIPHGFGKGNVVMNGNTSAGTITWNLNGFNEIINGLETSLNNAIGCIIENTAPATISILTVGENDQSGTFAGSLRDAGGTLALTKVKGGRLTLSGPNAYTGNTLVNGGALALVGEGTIASSADVSVNSAILDVSGLVTDFTATGPVRLNGGTLVAGQVNAVLPTLTATNAGLSVTLNPAEVNVQATALTTGGTTNFIHISSVVNISSYPAVFTVVDYTGAIGGTGNNFALGTVPSLATTGYVSNDIVNTRIVVVLLNGPKPLTWRGSAVPDWDEGVTENWLEFKGTPNEAPASFFTGDVATLDDTGETNRLNLVGVLNPGGVNVNNATVNYTFTGSGLLTGLGSLVKSGAGSLTLANSGASSFSGGLAVNGGSVTFATDHAISGGMTIAPGTSVQVGTNGNSGSLPNGTVINEGSLTFNRGANAYTVASRISGSGTITKNDAAILTLNGLNNTLTGAVVVAAGTLRPNSASALGVAEGITTVNNGATLDVNALQLNTEPVVVSGAGVGGAGAIINGNATQQLNAMGDVTLAGHTTFGGTGRWDIRGGAASLSTGGNAYNLTKVGNNQFTLVGVTVDPQLATITVSNGIFAVETTTSSLGNPASPFIVYPNGTLQFFNTTTPLDKVFQLHGNGQTNTVNVGAGIDNSIVGPITLNGATLFNFGGAFNLALNGTVGGTGSLTARGGGTLTINGAATYAGNTVVAAGTLVLNNMNNGGGMLTNTAGSVITGRGTNTGPVRINGALLPGGTNVAGPFGAGSLTWSNATATFDLATTDINNAFPANDVVYSTGALSLQGTNTFTLNPVTVGVITNGQVITLIHYSGALTGGSNNIRLIAPIGYGFRLLDPATTANAIQLIVDKAPLIIAWRGGAAGNRTAWDVTTTNWVNAADNTTPVSFTTLDGVTFGDTQNTNFVELIGALQPGSITANNAAVNYTLGGAGRLTGAAALTVQGGGAVTIANAGSNDLTGPVNVNAGTLQIGNGGAGGNLGSGAITNQGNLVFNRTGTLNVNNIHGSGVVTNNGTGVAVIGGVNTYDGSLTVNQGTVRAGSASALGSVVGATYIANGATLDVNGQVLNLEAVNVSGAGVGGGGAIVNTGADQLNAMGNVLLEGHTVFGGPGRWDIRGGAATLNTGGLPYNLTKIGPGQFSLVGVLVDPALGNIDVQGGTFAAETTTTSLGDPAKTITVQAGATFQLFNSATPFDKIFLLTGNGVANTVNVSSGTANSIIGPIALTGDTIINITAANALTLPGLGPITGPGSLAKNGTGTLNLVTGLEYAGNTTINGGALVVSGPAALTNSPVVTVNATLDVTALNNGPTLERRSGQTLMGNGSINGSVSIATGGTLAPGLSIGVLTVTNNVNLSGTTVMEVQSGPSTNDRLRSITGTITYGGTLIVTNLGPIVGTNTYQLFQGALAGTFANVVLPNLPGVVWNTSNLNVNGTITAVQSVNTAPINLGFAITGNGLNISWPNDHLGWRLEGQTNSINIGISNNWVTVAGSATTNRVVVPLNPANGAVFYRLVYP